MTDDKLFLPPSESLFPIPAVMVSCCSKDGTRNNIITLAWVGTLSSNPPEIGICIRPSRYSHDMIEATGDFVVNIPSETQAKQADLCGQVSGRHEDKFALCGLTPAKARKVKSPIIKECPMNIECKLVRVIKDYSKSHHLFLGEIVSVDVSAEYGEEMDISKIKPLVFCNGEYWSLGQFLGTMGFSKEDSGSG